MYEVVIPWLTLRPSIRRLGSQLIIRTPLLLRVMCLWVYEHTVRLDGEAKYVLIRTRFLWFFERTRILRFRDVAYIRYSFGDFPTSFDVQGRTHDTMERFTIEAVLTESEERVPICSFRGEGAAGDVRTLMMGDDLVDLKGDQENSSRELVEELCDLTGWRLGRPSPAIERRTGGPFVCEACGREVAPRPKCWYCGGRVSAKGPRPG